MKTYRNPILHFKNVLSILPVKSLAKLCYQQQRCLAGLARSDRRKLPCLPVAEKLLANVEWHITYTILYRDVH